MRYNRILTITVFCVLLGIVRASAQTPTPTPTITPTMRPASDYPTTWTIKNQTINEAQTLFQYDIYLAYTGPATDFKIGDVTLRIKFNTDALTNPRLLYYWDDVWEANLAYTDWYVKFGTYFIFNWPVGSVISLIEPATGVAEVDTNLVSTYTYAKQGYTDSLRALLSGDGDSLHNKIQFDISNIEEPFNIEWDTSRYAVSRKMPNEAGQSITAYATFEIEAATATPAETPTELPTETPIETPAITPTPTTAAPRVLKQGIRNDLIELRATVTDKDDRYRLGEAIEHLTTSLTPSWWTDDAHLEVKYGNKVFDEEKLTVNWLLDIIKDESSSTKVQDFVDRFVGADRLLAVVAIAEGTKNIVQANAALSKGDMDAATGKYVNAIIHYNNAWNLVAKK